MGLTVTQKGFDFMGDKSEPVITGTFAQVKYVLETKPALRGRVGAVVAEVWHEFYGLDHKIRNGQVDVVLEIIAGEYAGVPNYKTVSRNYHRVCEKHPDLYREPVEDGLA